MRSPTGNPNDGPPQSPTTALQNAEQGGRPEQDQLPTRDGQSSSSLSLQDGISATPTLGGPTRAGTQDDGFRPDEHLTLGTPSSATQGSGKSPRGGSKFESPRGWAWHERLRREKGAIKYMAHRFTGRDRWVAWWTSAKNIAQSNRKHFNLFLNFPQ